MKTLLEQLKQLKTIALTDAERDRIRAHAAHVMVTLTQRPRLHPLFQRGLHHTLRVVLSSSLFFILIGGTVSAIADNALPGDPLYAFKLNVNEEVRGFFQKTPEQKVAYNAQLVENRVKEIKTLAASQSLTKAKQATVQKALDAHIQELSDNLNTLSDVAPTAALDATTTLENTLKASKASIENTTTDATAAKEEALSTVDGTLQQVSTQEVKIISKQIDSISSDVAATSTTTIDSALASPSVIPLPATAPDNATSTSSGASVNIDTSSTPAGP